MTRNKKAALTAITAMMVFITTVFLFNALIQPDPT